MHLPRTPSFRLTGKRALVTGASSGIGLGCAVALAEAGARVTLAARRLDKLQQVQAEFVAEGWKTDLLQLDIADVDATRTALGDCDCFDIVVNSAGLARHGAALDTKAEDFDAVMGVNVRGAYFLAQAAAKKMTESGKRGSIIFISSQMAKVGGIDRSVYCGSKHAIEGIQKAMAIEWGKAGIRVNSVCPTFIKTPLTQSTFNNPERVKWIEDHIKLGRVGEVEDIMGAVLFLASEASALVTGTSILVDGGWTAS